MKNLLQLNLIFSLFIITIILIIITEIVLRVTLGLGNPLIYIADEKIGYLIAPNQQTKRNGNFIKINQYSMRSNDINLTRNKDTLRIFLIGDSIANGGWWTDQNKTISALLQQQLTGKFPNLSNVEVLNASANSWAPRNELAYLEKFGTFDSQIIILLLNTDDFFGLKPSSLVVGNTVNYPDKKPMLALQELTQKFIFNKSNKLVKNPPKEMGDLVIKNLNAITKINAIAINKNAKLIVAITPLKRELIPPYSKEYENKARQRLAKLTKNKNIIYLDFLPIFKAEENPEIFYHDHIHLNTKGNQLLAEILAKKIYLYCDR